MPSLLGTYVAANYGRMTSVDTYGGITYNNLGTRNLAFLKISSAGTVDFTAAAGPDTDASNISGYAQQISSFNPATSSSAQTATTIAWADSNSYFSVAVRTIQQFAEVYMVGLPYTTGGNSGFIVAVSLDTANSAAASSNVEVWQNNGTTGYIGYPTLNTFGALAAQIKNALQTAAVANSAAGADTLTSGNSTAVTITQVFPWGTGLVAPGGSASAT
jgi:hypothetical protein